MSTAERAHDVVTAIATRLRAANRCGDLIPAEGVPLGLYHGRAGVSLLFAELAVARPEYRQACHDWLTASVRHERTVPGAGLYGGATGLAFAMRAAARQPDDYAGALRDLDQRIVAVARDRIRTGDADVITGLAGLVAYLLAGPHVDTTRDVLTALATSTDVPQHHDDTRLGMAHGIAGPLAALALAWTAGVRVAGHRAAVETLARRLLAQRRDDADGAWWPGQEHLRGPVSSWCWGTPGIGRALYLAGVALGEDEWEDAAVAAFHALLSRIRRAGPTGPSLCHGWAGILQATWRMAGDTGDDQLTSRLEWLAHQVVERTDGVDAAGFSIGSAGVALALHAFACDDTPATRWDRALLLD